MPRKAEHKDHPRRCGENYPLHAGAAAVYGSPPQVRGKPRDGITGTNAVEDHPRRCGENCSVSLYCRISGGSPPQVRGKPEGSRKIATCDRITPAGAGKTMWKKIKNYNN